MTSVVLADDQDLVREGIGVVLRAHGVDVVGEAADGLRAVQVVRRTEPDVVLMDLRMPVLDGIRATARLVAEGSPTKVLVLTTYDADDLVHRALRAGAAGFLLKSVPAARLADGVRLVAAGEALLAPTVTRRLVEHYAGGPAPGAAAGLRSRLTGREADVLTLVARGLSNDEIAAELVVSTATVKTHVNRVFAKLGLASRAQAVVTAYECGLVVPGRAGPADRVGQG